MPARGRPSPALLTGRLSWAPPPWTLSSRHLQSSAPPASNTDITSQCPAAVLIDPRGPPNSPTRPPARPCPVSRQVFHQRGDGLIQVRQVLLLLRAGTGPRECPTDPLGRAECHEPDPGLHQSAGDEELCRQAVPLAYPRVFPVTSRARRTASERSWRRLDDEMRRPSQLALVSRSRCIVSKLPEVPSDLRAAEIEPGGNRSRGRPPRSG